MFSEFWSEFGELITQIVAFVIFFWIMKKFAWGPVMAVLDERQRRIEHGFDDIKRRQAEADGLRQQYDARLRDIEQEARTRIQEAIAEGRRVAEEITEHARQEAAAITDRAQRNIQLELAKARVELRDELVSLTIEASERLMRDKYDESAHHRLVGAFIDDLEGRLVK